MTSTEQTSTEQWNGEQFDKNYVYHQALKDGKWREAIHALRNGAQVGYKDPFTSRLDIEIARMGGERAMPLVVVLKEIYRELGRLPQATAIVTDIVDKHMRFDLSLARPDNSALTRPGVELRP